MCVTDLLRLILTFSALIATGSCGGCLPYRKCQDVLNVFNPQNYLEHLPSLSLPYRSNMVIPSPYIPVIKPTPVTTTKVINIVTKYVSVNPVCIKLTRRKPPCKLKKNTSKNNPEVLITKEYFVRDRKNTTNARRSKLIATSDLNDLQVDQSLDDVIDLEGSEESKAISPFKKTPILTPSKIKELLIEDRLDHLEHVLPHYTRRRVYQTSTITVTKTRSDLRSMATLLVKNCMPQGFEYCSPKRRKSRNEIPENMDNDDD